MHGNKAARWSLLAFDVSSRGDAGQAQDAKIGVEKAAGVQLTGVPAFLIRLHGN